MFEEFDEIWLEPYCTECNRTGVARSWCSERGPNCEECGAAWVLYEISVDQPWDTDDGDEIDEG